MRSNPLMRKQELKLESIATISKTDNLDPGKTKDKSEANKMIEIEIDKSVEKLQYD
jgi:hypothetical protein